MRIGTRYVYCRKGELLERLPSDGRAVQVPEIVNMLENFKKKDRIVIRRRRRRDWEDAYFRWG